MAEDDGEVDTDFPGTHMLHICYSTKIISGLRIGI